MNLWVAVSSLKLRFSLKFCIGRKNFLGLFKVFFKIAFSLFANADHVLVIHNNGS